MEHPGQSEAGLAVAERLRQVEVGESAKHGGLFIFPMLPRVGAPALEPLEYQTLAEAIASGSAAVEERPSATVPELVLVNKGAAMVLVLDGEEIVGGRQNRIVNASFLVGSGSKTAIPVSCVEAGRWHEVSKQFSPGEVSYFSLKRDKHLQVRDSLRSARTASSDQGAIWADIAERHRRSGSESETGAMNDLYRDNGAALADYERELSYVDGAVGFVAALGGHVVGAELFDQARTAALLWPRLIRSYALDTLGAAGAPGEEASVARSRAIRFLARGHAARYEEFASLALGQDVRFDGDGVVGAALVYREVPVHVSLFRLEERRNRPGGRIARGSVRRSLLS